ncbi:hypothetical protein AB0Y20_01060 [Heyndrickxia oleronia]|uniref:hypothetical protein n=1 Tax=Heyndrickxia oleronia TaxID=38875 RepID=UPI003F26C759
MREPERIERIIKLITEIWNEQPDTRLMQLMSNLSWEYSKRNNDAYKEYSYSKWEDDTTTIFMKDIVNVDCFHLEDDKLEEFLKLYLSELNSNQN